MIEHNGCYYLEAKPYIQEYIEYNRPVHRWDLPQKLQTYFLVEDKIYNYLSCKFLYTNFVVNKAFMIITKQKDEKLSKYYFKIAYDPADSWRSYNQTTQYFKFDNIANLSKFKMISANI